MLSAMQRIDSLTVLPTGGGKSLCYQAPAMCYDGMAVVVSPLIALMKDQVDALTANGISAACVNSSLSTDERQAVAARVRDGSLKLLFVAPERLVQQRTLDFLANANVSFFAIDEAHCISNWGHDFRPEYRQLACLRTSFPDASIHAFTATATEQVRTDILTQLGLQKAEVFVGNFDRPNLQYRVERRYDALGQMRDVIDRHPKESGIIYCISRKKCEETAASLKALGYNALAYHAGFEADQRRRHQEMFIDEKIDIIVATVAFGMGIDKSNVRYVIHAEIPSSIEAYQQESGRAGRDGLEAECCLLHTGRDVSTWEFLINQSDNDDNRQASLKQLMKMEAFCSSNICRHRLLVQHFGQKFEPTNCSACDVCLKEIEPIKDALVTAQKVISGVYRQEQRFGAEYTGLVLRGSRSKKVLANGHDKLSTYGLLKDEPDNVVRNWIDQLVAQGYLIRAGDHSVLQITQLGSACLKGHETPTLTRPKTKQHSVAALDKWEGVDRGLFEALRSMRMDIATDRNVPPYVILGDVSLRELAKFRPTSESNLLKVYGIGQAKCQEFGDQILQKVKTYCEKNELESNLAITVAARSSGVTPAKKTKPKKKVTAGASQSFELFDQKVSLGDVTEQLGRAFGTVAGYLVQYIQQKKLTDATDWIPNETVQKVEAAADEVGDERLKPIFDHLNSTISYSEIRVVLAARAERP
ncbi:UNVERIFIED_CONTAM: hypothetical protein GTU68_044954 [Idotea baltica]|nr:hypothetical protein [Idotea baltica]